MRPPDLGLRGVLPPALYARYRSCYGMSVFSSLYLHAASGIALTTSTITPSPTIPTSVGSYPSKVFNLLLFYFAETYLCISTALLNILKINRLII